MQYRTVIEIISEASNENDAIDIAGEFLRGNVETGVSIRCFSKPLKPHTLLRVSILFISAALLASIYLVRNLTHNTLPLRPPKDISAVQPPLKTHQGTGFKETWQSEENKKSIEQIKK